MTVNVEQIGRYRITGELGRGAMGIVYQAQDPAIGRVVAIKSIRLGDLTDEAERARLRDRLFREAQSAGALSHPNIVTIFDVAEQDGLAYVCMEVVKGPSLDKRLAAPPRLTWDEILAILRQAAAALDYAHKNGIVHRDIKPSNIMLHEDGTAKITDFGVAKIVSQQMTQTGTLMGTPNYMSPEQVQAGKITGQADQFSLGVIAYEILAGQKPFGADNLPALLFKIVREEPAPPHELNPSIGEAMELVLRRALAKDPLNRFGSCSEFIAALETASKSSHWVPVNTAAFDSSSSSETLAQTAMVETTASKIDVSPHSPTTAVPESRVISPAHIDAGDVGEERQSRPYIKVAAAVVFLLFCAAGYFFYRFMWVKNPAAIDEAGRVSLPASPSPATPVPAILPPPQEQTTQPAPVATPAVTTAPAPALAAPATASFHLTTNPPGAQAVFDDDPALRCASPCDLNLSMGRHAVALQREGYRDTQRIFILPDEPGLIVNLDAAVGILNLVTNPANLTVLVDGKEQADKTPARFQLGVGTHHVTVLRGAEKQEFDVDIHDGGLTQKTLSWN